MNTKRGKGSMLSDVARVCEGGIAIKIQTDVQVERCEGPEARGEMTIAAMRRASDEGAAVLTFANETAMMTTANVLLEKCAAVGRIEARRLVNGRTVEDGTRLAASEASKDDENFAAIRIEGGIALKPAGEGIRILVEAKPFVANAAGKIRGGTVMFHAGGIVVNNDAALLNEGGINPVALVKDLDRVALSLLE